MRTASEPAFLHLEPRRVPRPWGGTRVARRFGWDASEPCGEWWLASSYPGTETALRAPGAGGPDLAAWLDGPGRARGCPAAADFPVLLKFLDAETRLSLQVHPDDAVAARHGLPNGKTEAWHVLDAEPGAFVHLGLAEGVTPAQLMACLRDDPRDDEVVSLMRQVPVRAGDTVYVKAGTVHALEGGISLFEVQQNSDATYRMHDWGRGRELHLDAAADAVQDLPDVDAVPAPAGEGWVTLCEGPAFRMRRAVPAGSLELGPSAGFALLTVLAGRGQVAASGQTGELAPGDTLLVLDPATVEGDGLELLAVDVPG